MLILGCRIFFIAILLPHGFFHKLFQQASPYPEVMGPTGTACMRVKSLQSCPALCDPVDCSPPGSSVHGILQERILERVAMPFSGTADIATYSLILLCLCGKQNSALAEEGRYPGTGHGKWVGSRLKGLKKKQAGATPPTEVHWEATLSGSSSPALEGPQHPTGHLDINSGSIHEAQIEHVMSPAWALSTEHVAMSKCCHQQ